MPLWQTDGRTVAKVLPFLSFPFRQLSAAIGLSVSSSLKAYRLHRRSKQAVWPDDHALVTVWRLRYGPDLQDVAFSDLDGLFFLYERNATKQDGFDLIKWPEQQTTTAMLSVDVAK